VRQIAGMLPGSLYQPRGKSSIESLVEKSRVKGLSTLVLFYERKGNPARIEFIHIHPSDWEWNPTKLLVKGVKLQSEKLKNDDEGIQLKGKLCDLFDPEVFDESEYSFVIDKTHISFMKGKQVVGPVMKLEEVISDI
jgi:rRNA maturation protein Rpf1